MSRDVILGHFSSPKGNLCTHVCMCHQGAGIPNLIDVDTPVKNSGLTWLAMQDQMSFEGSAACGRLVLSDYVTLATDLQACCRRMTKVSGAQKLERRIGTEIKFFQTLSRKDERTQSAHLQSSNLSHFAAIVHAATHLAGVTAVLRPFTSSDRRHSLLVDVVADEGRSWVKVVARKGQALHLIWAGEGQYGERDMVQQLQECVQCADHHPVNFRPPRVHATFYNHVTMPMEHMLQQEGVTVWGRQVCVDPKVIHKLRAVRHDDEDEEEDYDPSDDYDDIERKRCSFEVDDHWEGDDVMADMDEDSGRVGLPSDVVVDWGGCLDGNVVCDGDEGRQRSDAAPVSDLLASSGETKHGSCPEKDVKDLEVESSGNSLCGTGGSLTRSSVFGQSDDVVSITHGLDQTSLTDNPDASRAPRTRAHPCPDISVPQHGMTATSGDKLETCDLETDSWGPAEDYDDGRERVTSLPAAHPCREAPVHDSLSASSRTLTTTAWILSTQSHQCLSRILAACPDYSAFHSESFGADSSRGREEEGGERDGGWQGRVNLDITTLITLVSSVCHGGCYFRFQDKVLDQQAAEERQQPSLPGLQQFLQGRELIVCHTAWSDFNGIVQLLGGPTEQKRASQLLNRVIIVDDQVSARAAELKLKGKVKDRSKVVFGTGDQLQAVTVTANSGFVRAAECQGVSFAVYMHPARALTEQKESSAVPL